MHGRRPLVLTAGLTMALMAGFVPWTFGATFLAFSFPKGSTAPEYVMVGAVCGYWAIYGGFSYLCLRAAGRWSVLWAMTVPLPYAAFILFSETNPEFLAFSLQLIGHGIGVLVIMVFVGDVRKVLFGRFT